MHKYRLCLEAEASINGEKTPPNSPTNTLIADIRSEFVNASSAIGTIDKLVLAYYDSGAGTTTEYDDLSASIATGDWSKTGTPVCEDTDSDNYNDKCTGSTYTVSKTMTATADHTINRLRIYSGTKLYFEISFSDTDIVTDQEVKVEFSIKASWQITGYSGFTTDTKVYYETEEDTSSLRGLLVLLIERLIGKQTSVYWTVTDAKFQWYDDSTSTWKDIEGTVDVNRTEDSENSIVTAKLYITPTGTIGEEVTFGRIVLIAGTDSTNNIDYESYIYVGPENPLSEALTNKVTVNISV